MNRALAAFLLIIAIAQPLLATPAEGHTSEVVRVDAADAKAPTTGLESFKRGAASVLWNTLVVVMTTLMGAWGLGVVFLAVVSVAEWMLPVIEGYRTAHRARRAARDAASFAARMADTARRSEDALRDAEREFRRTINEMHNAMKEGLS